MSDTPASESGEHRLLHDVANPLTAVNLVLAEPSLEAAEALQLIKSSIQELNTVVTSARQRQIHL